MLTELHIQNFALIDELRLELGAGFGALTGETGAGKSIIVDAMSAALGERTGSEVIRTGADRALVEAVFDVSGNARAQAVAAEAGFEPEDGILILSREITRSGRSQARINARPATTSVVKDITAHLIDIHGQHEHQSLLTVPLHIDIFDARLGEEVASLREAASGLHAQLLEATDERDRLLTGERERARMLDLYGFQAEEIGAANLTIGEEEELDQERNRLANAEKLFDAASLLYDALGGDQGGGAVDSLNMAAGTAIKIARMDPSMAEFVETVNAALFSAQEAFHSIGAYREEVEANPGRLEQIEERLNAIRTLKRKYGDDIQAILHYAAGLSGKIGELTHSEDRSLELAGRIDDISEKLTLVSEKLTALRKASAPDFENAVERELAQLAMEKTRFEVSLDACQPGPKGADAVEFLISPNPGEPVRPLAKIASGGEMSRVMLALKTVTAEPEVPTLVFDEIDSGIGGRTAQVLGERLTSLGQKCQVLCVTHLPQIASKAQHQFSVEKRILDGRNTVVVKLLAGEERVEELARMLGASGKSGVAAEHAREMLSLANQGDGKARQ